MASPFVWLSDLAKQTNWVAKFLMWVNELI